MTIDRDKVRQELDRIASREESKLCSDIVEITHILVQRLGRQRVNGINLRIERERLDFVMTHHGIWECTEELSGVLHYCVKGVTKSVAGPTYGDAIDRAMRMENVPD